MRDLEIYHTLSSHGAFIRRTQMLIHPDMAYFHTEYEYRAAKK